MGTEQRRSRSKHEVLFADEPLNLLQAAFQEHACMSAQILRSAGQNFQQLPSLFMVCDSDLKNAHGNLPTYLLIY